MSLLLLPWPWRSALLAAILSLMLLQSADAQNSSESATAPAEAKAFFSIFKKWGLTSSNIQWNTTEDPCSGAALGDSVTIDDTKYNPFIKCDCSDDNGATCHITAFKVYTMDVVGDIPDELWNFTFLTNLNLAQNYLTGPLSPSIGNLTKMQWLTVGTNALSGDLPKELGQLTDLKSLSLSTNYFTGSLPSEIGNIVGLEQLYIGSCGVSGEIPSSFAGLVNLQTVWAPDIELNGSIPEFIGNWTQLTDLRIEGNSFTGSIPSSFSNLTALETLRIGDLSNGSSSLEFITSLTSINILVLRNITFSGSIPTAIGGLTSLKHLDLTFNNIAGKIPDALFLLGSLQYLFLGNNKLSGVLPSQKSSSLLNIDVSYNQLTGSIPSWVSGTNLQLNLVANNFTSTTNSALPSGLNCLQSDFPCNHGSPRYSSFAVNCGGPEMKSSDGTVFEKENESLGPATYYVTDTNRWGVSNAGYFLFSNNASFTASSTRQFSSTLDSELFQTARLSPGSLRYYGLGLENGNYTLVLQFAELVIQNGKTWRSLGSRVFDIYIQGKVALKSFDIRKEAGGQSYAVVRKNFTAQVKTNHLDIHLSYAGKGTCCVPAQGTYGPSVSAISITPNFKPTVSNMPPSNKGKIPLVLAIVIPLGCLCLCLLFLTACYFIQKRRLQAARDEELIGVEAKPYIFSYSELKSATEDFNVSHKLGEGGFGPVYKGTMGDGRVVAVKQLSFKSRQGKSQFVAEIATISAVQHRNLVKLYGCCIEGEKRLLVYEFLENGSLDQALFGNGKLKLNWTTRFEICMGVARGLTYLHQESRLRIVHRDVKASNILIDSELSPKISDFGLAKLYNEKETHISTGVAGTIGYLAPEYAMRGHLTEKVDVFSFGVLALEIVSGRANSDISLSKEKMYLLEWTWQLHETNQEINLVDEKLQEFDEEEVKRVIRVALLCTQTSHGQRPAMSRVVAMLSGDVEVGAVPAKPGYLADWRYDDASFQSSTISTARGAYTTTTSATMTPGTRLSPPLSNSRPGYTESYKTLYEIIVVPAKPGCLADWRYNHESIQSSAISTAGGAYTTSETMTPGTHPFSAS